MACLFFSVKFSLAFSPLQTQGRFRLSGKGSQRSLTRGGNDTLRTFSLHTQASLHFLQCFSHRPEVLGHALQQGYYKPLAGDIARLDGLEKQFYMKTTRWLSWEMEQRVSIKLSNSNRTSPGPHCRVPSLGDFLLRAVS